MCADRHVLKYAPYEFLDGRTNPWWMSDQMEIGIDALPDIVEDGDKSYFAIMDDSERLRYFNHYRKKNSDGSHTVFITCGPQHAHFRGLEQHDRLRQWRRVRKK